ncbi:maltose ABC transporter permease MalF [Marinobacterium arenosum]|uniref:maltose ABC transporter permease MalF n=1 Tax=Marinobacterium arenosum TaxID=2862496 RepID=UPI0021061F40|nr:maltose ABC transporter permease MalF [Marinobacterium arenosum]
MPSFATSLKLTAALAVNLMALYLVVVLYAQQKIAFALLVLLVVSSASYVFFSKRAYAHRYVYPAVAGMGIFVIFPLLYTVGIGFTNYSASNLLDLERVQQYHLSQSYTLDGGRYPFKLYSAQDRYRLQLQQPGEGYLVSQPFALTDAEVEKTLELHESNAAVGGEALKIRDVIKLKKPLQSLVLSLPDGGQLRMSGLREFAARAPVYTLEADGSLRDNRSGERLTINHEKGFYQRADGELLSPGFVVTIGADNFLRVLTDDSIRGPFLQIFLWTLAFSAGTVLFTMGVGLLLANLLQWDRIGGKAVYRTLLILPYAVPAFISILVFKGLFNQNFGEINLVLQGLFGLRPDWFSEPAMARSMILIVNTWLGYPYMMLLCMGLLQSIPQDLYEASAMDGAGPLDNLFRITLPLIIKPLTPLLIATFAFNFNNFVLISLLTGGAPDIIGASTPAGTTDLLVSYTYRIAFQDSGQDFGLAAAIATMIFLLVGGMALLKLRLSKMEV